MSISFHCLLKKYLMRTEEIAVRGTDKNTPRKPNKAPKKKIPKIIHKGWSSTFLPIKFGVRKFDSKNCPAIKIITTGARLVKLIPHWIRPSKIPIITPKPNPTYGIKESKPVIMPILKPWLSLKIVKPKA